MNFTFTWILDKFGFQAKPIFEMSAKKEVAPKATTVAKKVARKTVPKATTRKTTKK